MSGDALSLVFNGASVLLIPFHLIVQRWKQGHAVADAVVADNGVISKRDAADAELPPHASQLSPPASASTTASVQLPPSSTTMQLTNSSSCTERIQHWCNNSSSPLAWPQLPKLAQYACFGGGLGILSALMGVGGLPIAVSYLTVFSDCPHHLVQVLHEIIAGVHCWFLLHFVSMSR